jgi:ABC-type oligopeptide transport system ATPase subunit
MFKKATRKTVWLKLGLTGASGSGKTTGALKVARGLVGEEGKIALIDTENGSASLYSDITEFDVCNLEPPFEDKKFSEAIKFAAAEGYDAVIIDSASHFWEAVLDYKDKLDKRGGNSFTNWKEAGDRFKDVLGAVLQSQIHVILCLRSKMEHVMEKDDRGKNQIKKVGMAPIMRDGIEYEFTVVFDLDMNHNAASSKDRTRLFDGRFFQLTEEVGKQLNEWRQGDGAQVAAPKPVEEPAKPQTVSEGPTMATSEQIQKINTYFAALQIDKEGQQKAFDWAAPKGSTPYPAKSPGGLLKSQADKLIEELQRRMNEVPANSNEETIKEAGKQVASEPEPKEEEVDDVPYHFASELKAMLEPHEEKVNARLIEWGWIESGQTWKDLKEPEVKKIKSKPDAFCKSVGIELPKEAA